MKVLAVLGHTNIFLIAVFAGLAQSPPPATFNSASLIDTIPFGTVHSCDAESLATGDFNTDGKPDLIVIQICSYPPQATILLSNGNGTFSTAAQFSLNVRNAGDGINSGNANLVTIGDFNGDGKLDFAAYINGNNGVNGTNYLDVYLGDGAGGFTFSGAYTVGNQGMGGVADAVAAADVNGDGKLDLLAINSGDNTVTVLPGNGDGTFQTAALYSAVNRSGQPVALTTGDFNNDGRPDIAVAATDVTLGSGIYILLNNGNGTFLAPMFYSGAMAIGGWGSGQGAGIGSADLDGNGRLDVVLANNVGAWVFLGNGDGTFQAPVNYPVPFGDSVGIADVNGDKKLDLVVPDYSNSSVFVLLGNGNGTFQPGMAYATDWFPQSVAIADFNGDGKPDLAVGSAASPFVTLAPGNGDGTFRTGSNYDVAGNWTGQIAADFNNDGNLDVAVYGPTANEYVVQVMPGSSHGILKAPITTTVMACCNLSLVWMAAGDVNRDGKTDLVAAIGGSNPSEIGVLLGKGNGTFPSLAAYSTGTNQPPVFLILADLRNTGELDAVVSNADGSLSVLLNQGAGVYGSPTVIPGASLAGGWLATGDFNLDGKTDLVISDASNNSLNILLGNGDGTFHAPVSYEVDRNPSWVTVSDFNKDGKLDLATGGFNVGINSFPNGGIAVLLGNGDGTFAAPAYYSLFPNFGSNANPSYAAVVADVNLDGTPDLLVPLSATQISYFQAPYDAGLAVFLGNGDGTFQLENAMGEPGVVGGPFLAGTGSYGVIAGDFNSDGTPDAAVLNQYNYGDQPGYAYVTVLLNTTLPVSVSPLTLNFGAYKVNTSASQTVLLTNNTASTEPVSVSLTGPNAHDFTFKSGCGASLNGNGQHCTIQVTFKPTAGGTRKATLSLTVGSHAYTSQLTGIGLALTVSPASVNFGNVTVGQHSAPAPVTVTNHSSSAIAIISPGIKIVGAAATDYTQTNNCGGSIAGNTSCTINITFSPKKTGTRSADLQINDTDGKSPQNVALTGSGS